jgi:hypothetical protein
MWSPAAAERLLEPSDLGLMSSGGALADGQ